MNNPSISVIIPTHNRADFIKKTIESILNQTFDDFELIIVDDGSTDNTSEIISKISDPRLYYYHINNSERAAARNYGAKQAKGKYLNFFDSDDIAYPNHLQVASDFILNNQVEVFHQNFNVQMGNQVKKSTLKKSDNLNHLMVKGNPLSCNGVFINRKIFELFLFNTDRKLSASEDYELWIRLAASYKIHHIITRTSVIIDHDERSVFTMDKKKLIQRKLLALEYAFNDKAVDDTYKKHKKEMYAYTYSYIALHIALTKKNRLDAIRFLFKSIQSAPQTLFERRNLAIIKHILL